MQCVDGGPTIPLCADCANHLASIWLGHKYDGWRGPILTARGNVHHIALLKERGASTNVLTALAADTSRLESPCKQCSRMNDHGVSKCWMCECTNPCG